MSVTGEYLFQNYAHLLKKWKAEGLGRRGCAKRLSEELGQEIGHGAMRAALRLLAEKEPSAKRIALEVEAPEKDEEASVEELVAQRVRNSKKIKSRSDSHKKVVRLESKPIGLFVFGDPHVDNEGCDWATLYDHVQLARSTEGVLAACVGDMHDNWVGRLAKLYAKSTVRASDGWKLSEWLLDQLQWIAIVGGNHDAWAHGPGVDPMSWLTKKAGVQCYATDELRITLKWDDDSLEPLVWVLRHDFSGRSWYHPTHGPHKEAMLDGRCHILTAGHLHQWGELTTEQRHSRVTHALRVRGYKKNDCYAREKGFFEQSFGESVLIVINPQAEGPGRITTFWDLEVGCNYLTWLRSRT